MSISMESKEILFSTLGQIDGRGYKAYKEIERRWFDFFKYRVCIPYVQRDPFATPSKVFIQIEREEASFPSHLLENRVRLVAVEDYITRRAEKAIGRLVYGRRGSGKSGLIQIAPTQQEVLERSSVDIGKEVIELRLLFGLPARGRRVLGFQARDMFFKILPQLVEESLYDQSIDGRDLEDHVYTIEDQNLLRSELKKRGLVAFIGNGSILPRRSGIDDRPLRREDATLFTSPKELLVEFQLPYHQLVRGMGIEEGITLIVGGGYHGKSTLLEAIERGVYNHIPGDGRELVVTREDGVKIRAEDGRRVERVDISPFIGNLPQELDTTSFSTENASGSTSQAANIMEALEMGSQLLLIDEDTCATNFMLRDVRMQHLVRKDKEPITPFIDKVKPLFDDHRVSTILVVGGAGDYFHVAHRVLMMDGYTPEDVTERAREIASLFPSGRLVEGGESFGEIPSRCPQKKGIDPRKGSRVKVRSMGQDRIQFGREKMELGALEQIISKEQTKAIGDLLVFALKEDLFSGFKSLREILEELDRILDSRGLGVISPYQAKEVDYARPRLFEVGGALNRLRTLRVQRIEDREDP